MKRRLLPIAYWILTASVITLFPPRIYTFGGVATIFLIVLILAVVIWKDKYWGYGVGLLVTLLLTIGAVMGFRFYAYTPCEGLGCIGLIIPFLLAEKVLILTVITTPLFYFLFRKKKVEIKRVVIETVVFGLAFLLTTGIAVGIPYQHLVRTYPVSEEKQELRKTKREEGVRQFKQTLEVSYPTYLPLGWKKVSEYVDSTGSLMEPDGTFVVVFTRSGVFAILERQGSSRLNLYQGRKSTTANPSYFVNNYGTLITQKEGITINNKSAIYAAFGGGRNRNPSWYGILWTDDSRFLKLICHDDCGLSKNTLIKMAESIKQ